LSFPALQHSKIQEPFFSPLSRRPESVALLPESPTRRVWLPSRWYQPLNPWEPLSAPDTPGLRPSELSSSTVIGKTFRPPLSALALSLKTFSALNRRSDGFIPPWKPYPCALPDGLDPAGALALLGFTTSQALPPSTGPNQRLSDRVTFPVLAPLVPHETGSPHPQGFPSQRPGIFPYGTPACLAFLPSCLRALFEPVTPRGLFFPLEGPRPLAKPDLPLFAGNPSSPTGRA